MRKLLFALFAVAFLALFFGLRASADQPAAFKVIVNPKVAGRAIPRDVLAQIYLGKVKRWGDGRPIVAVDLSSTSAVREGFSGTVLGMPVAGVQRYWMQLLASGGRPPVTRQSDEDVIAFVAAQQGGIGYVSEAAPVPETVRPVAVQ